jgi:hypothetical protein
MQMKSIQRVACFVLVLAAILVVPASMFGQSPFDGTWVTKMDQSKFSPKPIAFPVKGGMYDCSSCVPKIDVKADGTDQAVSGQSYDTVSVREIDSKSIEVTTKKNGKIDYQQTRTADGETLTVKTTGHPKDSDQTTTSGATATRIGKAPAGANATSGSWRLNKVNVSDNGVTNTYKTSGDELAMSTPTGDSYTAKLDGKDYPFKGTYSYDSVSLKKIDKNTIEETDKRGGKVIDVSKMSVSADGKKMTVVTTSKLTGRVTTYLADKQ